MKLILVVLVALGVLAFANEEETPDNYVNKIVRSAQDSAPKEAQNGIVSISKSLVIIGTSYKFITFYLLIQYYFLMALNQLHSVLERI